MDLPVFFELSYISFQFRRPLQQNVILKLSFVWVAPQKR